MAPIFLKGCNLKAVTKAILSITGYEFNNENLLEKAFTHDSVGNCGKNFERLEFIGDAGLSLSISNSLYENPKLTEGQMSKMRALLVRKETIAEIIRSWKLEPFFKLGKSMNVKDLSDTIYADFFESLLGAIFRDSDYKTLNTIVIKIFSEKINAIVSGETPFENAKSKLQELTMSKKVELPIYVITKKTGSAHNPTYSIELKVMGKLIKSKGNSIKIAEMEAAKKALKVLL